MNYCMDCGTKLILKHLDKEGYIPYCKTCQKFCFPVFSSAVSMILFNSTKDKILLIQQYDQPFYILPAGYINKGENALQTVIREIKEELQLEVSEIIFNTSEYYAPSNTCMFNFVCVCTSEQFTLDGEVDHAYWFEIEQAKKIIKENSLAKRFLLHYLDS